MIRTQGPVMSEEQADALKFCRMVIDSGTRFYICRRASCGSIYRAENWARSED